MRLSRTLRNLLLGYFAVHIFVGAISLFVLTAWLRDQMLVQTRHRMQDLCYSLQQHVRQYPDGMRQKELLEYLERLDAKTGARFTMINDEGVVIVDSRTGHEDIGDHGNRTEILKARKDGIGFQQRTSATLNVGLLYMAMPLFESANQAGDRENGFVRIAVEEKTVFATIAALQKFLWVFTIGSALFAGLLMTIFAIREMRPLQTFAEAARRVASGQYAMLPGITTRNDEWKSLADAFTVMQTELKQREARLLENGLRIEAVLSSMVEGVLAVDSKKQVIVANEAACDLLNVTQQDLLGSNLLEIVRIPELARVVQHTLLTQSEIQTEFDTISLPRLLLEARVTPLSDQREFGAAVVIHNVTELRALETMRQDFVANVSHELKTPLASIKAYAETLRLGAINDDKNNLAFVQQIEEQADVLDCQIADLLKLSELESGKSSFEQVSMDIANVFEKCRDRFQAEADRRDLQIIIETAPGECEFESDRIALRTVLDNLVSNAIRYARPSGEVRLSAEQSESGIAISISDNGIGISEENQQRIFQRFYRVDSARSRELGGTGLGLAIVKHTVGAMAGTIEVHSKPGQGSTFTVTLPNL